MTFEIRAIPEYPSKVIVNSNKWFMPLETAFQEAGVSTEEELLAWASEHPYFIEIWAQ